MILLLIMTTENGVSFEGQGHWNYSPTTEQYHKNLDKLGYRIADGVGKGMGIDLYIAGGTWLLGHGDVALAALGIAGAAAMIVFVPSEYALILLKWRSRLLDKDTVWVKPTQDSRVTQIKPRT